MLISGPGSSARRQARGRRAGPPATVFLLSPANVSGERAATLLGDRARSALAVQLRSPAGAPLGEVFSFLSALYFRGKLTYARTFARPPRGIPGTLVITPGAGLVSANQPVRLETLRAFTEVDIHAANPRFTEPLGRDAAALAAAAGPRCRFVLLGSVASDKYIGPLSAALSSRLLFPPTFAGRGDMSRGGLLLRCVRAGIELAYEPIATAPRHGPRPPRLSPIPGITLNGR